MAFLRSCWRLLGSLELAVPVLLLLFLLTWLGTHHQVEHGLHAAIERYFAAWVVWQELIGSFAIPLPGARPLLLILGANLIVGGMIRARARRKPAILVTHLGMVLLLISGLVEDRFGVHGGVALHEGRLSAQFASHTRWELVVLQPQGSGLWREWTIPQERWRHAGRESVVFQHPQLPFALRVRFAMVNALPRPDSMAAPQDLPVIGGHWLQNLRPDPQAERNLPGLYLTLSTDQAIEQTLLWGFEPVGDPVRAHAVGIVDGGWLVALRKERHDLPFALRLDEFVHEFHPGTRSPRLFASRVSTLEPGAPDWQHHRIEMNRPLRHRGMVVYQSSWGPPDAGPTDRKWSGFAVARNPADRWPLWACLVIALGMLLHFLPRLNGWLRRAGDRS